MKFVITLTHADEHSTVQRYSDLTSRRALEIWLSVMYGTLALENHLRKIELEVQNEV